MESFLTLRRWLVSCCLLAVLERDYQKYALSEATRFGSAGRISNPALLQKAILDQMGHSMVAKDGMTEYRAAQVFLQAPVYPKVDVGRAREGEMLGEGRINRRRILATGIILSVPSFAPQSQRKTAESSSDRGGSTQRLPTTHNDYRKD